MKIELHGSGFDNFEVPRFSQGVDVQPEGDVYPNGKYPVREISMVTVLASGHLYIAVKLREDDEHLKANKAAAEAVNQAAE